MVRAALGLALGALVLFGGWAVTAGIATRSLSAVNAVFLSYAASLVLVGGYVLVSRGPIAGTREDVLFALASGVFLAAGTIAFYLALSRGSMAIVSAVAALYFIVPVAFDVVFLDAQLGRTNVAGLVLAAVAVALIAS